MIRCLLLISALTFVACFSHGQQIRIGSGVSISNFDYVDSRGNNLEGLKQQTKPSLSLGFQHAFSPRLSSLKYVVDITYTSYGASGSDPELDNFYSWDTSYLGINLGLLFEFFTYRNRDEHRRGFTFYVMGFAAPEFLLDGTQVLNNQIFSLAGEEQFESPILFVRGGLGVSYCVSKNLAAKIEYAGGKSFPIFSNSSDDENLQIISHNVQIGLLISILDCNYCYSSP